MAFVANVAGAGIPGALMTFAPHGAGASLFPTEAWGPLFGIAGSVWLTIGLVSLAGIVAPRRYAPILLLQMIYKAIWIVFTGIPLALDGGAEAPIAIAMFVAMIALFASARPWQASATPG